MTSMSSSSVAGAVSAADQKLSSFACEDEARKKWCNLRDQFVKEFKKIPKSKSGCSQECVATYRGKRQYFTSLLFLKDTVVPRETEGNVSLQASEDRQTSGMVSDCHEGDDLEEDASVDENTNTELSQVSFNETQTPSAPPQRTTQSSPSKAGMSRLRWKRPHEETIDLERKLLDIESKKTCSTSNTRR